MATIDPKKVYTSVTVDPNFSLPPGVIDLGYKDIDEPEDSSLTRSDETGEVINVDYDEVTYAEMGMDEGESAGATNDILFPPDSVTFVSQATRITSDGRTVVDVILEVDGAAAGVTYDVRLTKP